MITSKSGIDFIKSEEAFRPKMYLDKTGNPTIGYGTLIDKPEEYFLRTATITEEDAIQLLKNDLVRFEKAVNDSIKMPLTQAKFDSLISLAYNIGPDAFKSSTLVKQINAGASNEDIIKEFMKWIFSKGIVLDGLVKRRAKEAALFIGSSKKEVLIFLSILFFLGFSIYKLNNIKK